MKQTLYEGSFADVRYDGGSVLRVISKDGNVVHPVFLDNEKDRQFYSELLQSGVRDGDLLNCVDMIADNEESEHPNKLHLLKLRLGVRAMHEDFVHGSRGRPN